MQKLLIEKECHYINKNQNKVNFNTRLNIQFLNSLSYS